MKVDRDLLNAVVDANILDRHQADALYDLLKTQASQTPGFNFTLALYYLGGLVAVMSLRASSRPL